MNLIFSVYSHKGRIRANNEDNFFADGAILPPGSRSYSLDVSADAPVLLAVCDGMGGEQDGEIASETAVRKLAEMEDTIKSTAPEKLSGAVQAYADAVDLELKERGKRMGTTLALAVITEKAVRCFNIGDTRIYFLRSGKLTQLTHDHTLGARTAQKENICGESARARKNGNKLTRCIGIGSSGTVEEYPALRGKRRLMICSDGLTDMVAFPEIKKILMNSANPADAAGRLVQAALEHGGKDNITVVAADIPSRPVWLISKFMKWRYRRQ